MDAVKPYPYPDIPCPQALMGSQALAARPLEIGADRPTLSGNINRDSGELLTRASVPRVEKPAQNSVPSGMQWIRSVDDARYWLSHALERAQLIDVAELLQEYLSYEDVLENIHKRRIEVKTSFPQSPLDRIIMGSGHFLQLWAFESIISNAMLAMENGGLLDIGIERINREVRISIRDTGHGIHPDDLPHVWDIFASGWHKGLGGLGLFLAKETLEAHGGRITLQSDLGKGTEVTMWLPLASITGQQSVASAIKEVLFQSPSLSADDVSHYEIDEIIFSGPAPYDESEDAMDLSTVRLHGILHELYNSHGISVGVLARELLRSAFELSQAKRKGRYNIPIQVRTEFMSNPSAATKYPALLHLSVDQVGLRKSDWARLERNAKGYQKRGLDFLLNKGLRRKEDAISSNGWGSGLEVFAETATIFPAVLKYTHTANGLRTDLYLGLSSTDIRSVRAHLSATPPATQAPAADHHRNAPLPTERSS